MRDAPSERLDDGARNEAELRSRFSKRRVTLMVLVVRCADDRSCVNG